MPTNREKKASPATKVFIKGPLKTAAVAAGIAVMFGGHAIRMGPPAHHWGMKFMEESFKEIDNTFGK